MHRWRRLAGGGLCTVVVATTLLAMTASASTLSNGTLTGGGSWEGTVSLLTYPCPSLSCGGNFAGLFVGSVSGVDTQGNPYSIVWPDPTAPLPTANLAASFDYNETCPLSQTGSANGGFTISGGYVKDAALSGGAAHNGALAGSFSWTRAGLVVAVVETVSQATGGGVTLATQQLPGGGAGLFVPEGANTCATVQTVTAEVVGATGMVT